jgi:hypothetical protein
MRVWRILQATRLAAHQTRCGEGRMNSRRPVNSDVDMADSGQVAIVVSASLLRMSCCVPGVVAVAEAGRVHDPIVPAVTGTNELWLTLFRAVATMLYAYATRTIFPNAPGSIIFR